MQKLHRNRRLYRFLTLLLWGLGSTCVSAQAPGTWWEGMLKQARKDTSQVQAWLDTAFPLEGPHPDSALGYYQAVIQLSQTIRYPLGEGKGLNYSAIVLGETGRYAEAIAAYEQAIGPYQKAGYARGRGACLNGIGNVYNYQGDYAKASEYYLRAIEAFRPLPEKGYLALACQNLAGVFSDSRNYAQALEYHAQARAIYEELKDTVQLAKAWNDMGVFYSRQEKLQEAYENFLKAYRLASAIDHMDTQGMTLICQNMADALRKLKRYQEALPYAKQAEAVAQNLQSTYERAGVYFVLGMLYTETNQLSEARRYIRLSLELAEKAQSGRLLADAYMALSKLEQKAGNYQKAFEYLDRYNTYRDSMVAPEQLRTVAELEKKYETERKDREIAEKELELIQRDSQLQRQTFWLTGLGVGVGLLAVIVVLLVRTYRQSQRLQQERMAVLEQEQSLKTAKALISGEEKARTAIARELHDGLGGQLAALRRKIESLPVETDDALHLLDQSARDVRNLSHQLMPETLQRFGLKEALAQFLANLRQSGVIDVTFQAYDLDERLPADLELLVYRIVQELINNIIKHAHATQAMVQINRHEELLSLTIEDNGQGFDPRKDADGMGLHSIRSRLDYLGGKMNIEASPGMGASVFIELMLKKSLP
jgi:signal transduction histidine kinase